MRVLLVCSPEQDGYDPLVSQLVSYLVENGHTTQTVYDNDNSIVNTALSVPYDIILLINATRWHIRNRLRYKGRPWLCCASFCFDDLCTILDQGSVMDIGAQCYLSNCSTFVKQVSAVMLGAYAWKPVPLFDPLPRTNAIGCVLPSIADRDLCLLERTHAILKEAGKDSLFRLSIRDNEQMKLPVSLRDLAVTYKRDEEYSEYQKLNGYVLAPRVTDYRAGMVPSELIRAIAWGCLPLTIFHPALAPMTQIIDPMYTSLKAYDQAVRDMAAGMEPVRAHLTPELTPTPAEFIELMLSNYKRAKNAAS